MISCAPRRLRAQRPARVAGAAARGPPVAGPSPWPFVHAPPYTYRCPLEKNFVKNLTTAQVAAILICEFVAPGESPLSAAMRKGRTHLPGAGGT
jgi:hypothetical protein